MLPLQVGIEMKEYIVVTEPSREELEHSVVQHLAEGYELVGGVSVSNWTAKNRDWGYEEVLSEYTQALAR